MIQDTDQIRWQIVVAGEIVKNNHAIKKILESSATLQCEIQERRRIQPILKQLGSEKQKTDLIILNPYFKGADALSVLKAIRNKDRHVPIIILTNSKTPGFLQAASRIGISALYPNLAPESDFLIPMVLLALENEKTNQKERTTSRKFRYIIENLEDGYYENDLKGIYTYVNKTCAQHFGRSRDQLIGASYKDNTPRHLQKKLFKYFTNVYNTGRSDKVLDNEIIRPDGSSFYTEISVSLLRDEKGVPVGFGGISRDVTQRVLAQEALKKSEEKYRTILQNMEDSYFEVDFKGRIVFFSNSLCSMLGFEDKELTNMRYTKFMDKTNAEKMKATFYDVFEKKQPQFIDYEIIKKDGSKRYHEATISLMQNKFGKPVGFCGVSRDLTDKRLASEALRKNEEKYKNILNSIEDGYFEVGLDSRMQFFNEALCRMLGYKPEELISKRHTEYMDEENANKVYKAFNQVYRTGKSNLFLQYEITKSDGTKAYHEVTVGLMKDPGGKPVGFRGVARDLTEKKQANWALAASEERYRNILASIEDGYFEVDIAGNLTFCNDALPHIYGYTKNDLMNKKFNTYMDRKNARKIFKAYNTIFHTGTPNPSLQYEILTKQGEPRYFESSVSLIRDVEGKITGFRGISRDITERRQFIKALEKAKKEAEAASLAKSEFLANMSHEIRTPMNGILGMYNLLLGTNLDSEQADFVETGKRSAEALLIVINDILDFSKIEAGKLDIEVIEFDLRKSIEETVTLPAVQAHTKGLEFIYRIGHDVPTLLKGDPGRLRQIIMNLCTNAIKFTAKGEVVFLVDVEKEDDQTVKLLFTIKDTGIGISRKNLKVLFHSFQQVDASTTRKYGGTGLGLTISKKLSELMGGKIGVESKEGRGSKFWFTCVFEKQVGGEEKTFELLETLQGKRILIVDDNQTNLNILSGYLKHWGCGCDTADSGMMALSLMRAVAKANAPYDLVISDMLMPEMDGAELGTIIKNDPLLQSSHLIMLTSQGLRGDAAQMKKVGFAAYLNKPVRRSLLYDCMITVVNNTCDKKKTKTCKDLVTVHSISEEKQHHLKILLAEDNPVNRKLALHLLKKFGFNPDPVENGLMAVKALEKVDYDIVLMDIQMPEMDGLAATRTIRDPKSNVLNHDVLIIAMTANAMKGDRTICLNAGMDDYISKPIKPEQLLQVLRKNIKRFESEQE